MFAFIEFERRARLDRDLEASGAREAFRTLRVAVPGLGGVGGAHAETMARMGVRAFHIADMDRFETSNINRQVGARVSTLGKQKCAVLEAQIRSVQPGAEILSFPAGINEENLDAFLKDVDVVLDGLDFFCIGIRRALYREARARGIPVICAGPVGYGCSLLVFMPGGVSFDEYFRIEPGMTKAEMLMAFGLGVAPGLARDIDPSRLSADTQKGPALAPVCFSCAGFAAAEVAKIATGLGRITAAPKGLHYSLFRGRTVRLRPRPSLTRSLRGRLLRHLAFRHFASFKDMHEQELRARCAEGA